MDQLNVEYMQRALRLAERGLYTTDPNPRVGCVIVNQGKIVGEGWHVRAGEDHAEILALKQAGTDASGATVYVTLEPCSHTGKTPPCADALVKAGVARVVAAMQDPNPEVAGQGLQLLQDRGILTETGLLEDQARKLNPGFIKRMEKGQPYVRVKMAMSLDGRTAMASGESQWITGEAARKDVQHYRARSSAVLTGIGTVLADNPSMNVRLTSDDLEVSGDIRQPLRVVVDTHLHFPADAKMCTGDGNVLVVTGSNDAVQQDNYDVARVPVLHDRVNLDEVMRLLAEREINEVLVESGARLAGALMQRNLIDELVIYMAPHLMGDEARGLFSLPGLSQMKDRVELDIQDLRTVGKDLRIIAKPIYKLANNIE